METHLKNGEQFPPVVDVSWALILKQESESKKYRHEFYIDTERKI